MTKYENLTREDLKATLKQKGIEFSDRAHTTTLRNLLIDHSIGEKPVVDKKNSFKGEY